ncbi:MAG: DUF4886 domain-containing protein [Phocaeicola sp.]
MGRIVPSVLFILLCFFQAVAAGFSESGLGVLYGGLLPMVCVSNESVSLPLIKNNSLPFMPDTLRILGIGNSFTEDGVMFLPQLLKAAGIQNVVVAKISYGGCSLEQHADFYESQSEVYNYTKSNPLTGEWILTPKGVSMEYALRDAPWDVIVLQQSSGNSGIYSTYQPYLSQLMEQILLQSTNPNRVFAWQMTWAYSTNSTHEAFVNYKHDQLFMYHEIVSAVKAMRVETGIDLIIPSGVTIQSLRESHFNNPPLDLTVDGYHIDLGMGRYALACTWFEALIAPVLGVTVVGNSFTTSKGNVSVTDENREEVQKCAKRACLFNPFYKR